MAMMTKQGKPKKSELPKTIRRSPKKAQRTFAKTHDAAVERYGEGRRAHQTAYGALKHSFEKVGDHWEPKAQRGPSDYVAEKGSRRSHHKRHQTAGGVDANASKKHLMGVAKRLDIAGRSSLSKTRARRSHRQGKPSIVGQGKLNATAAPNSLPGPESGSTTARPVVRWAGEPVT